MRAINPCLTAPCRSNRRWLGRMTGVLAVALASVVFGAKAADSADFDYLSVQIQNAEADQARISLEQIISDIERDQGRYAYALVQPLTLLGDAHMTLDQTDLAAEFYAHALHLSRSNRGLFAAEQVDIVYRQATLHTTTGNLLLARQREEYAFEVLQRNYAKTSLELLPAIERLAEFYQRSHNFLGARVLFNQALDALEAQDSRTSEAAIPYLRGVAKTYLTERFPPYYSESQYDSRLQSGLRDLDMSGEYISISNFPAGERALQAIVSIRQQSLDDALLDPELADEDYAALALALHVATLDLADWHQMFGHIREARTLYKHLFAEIGGITSSEITFAQPKLLYFPKPKDPRRPDDHRRLPANGAVEVQFDVMPTGRIRKLETIASTPDGLMDFQVRRNLRDAIFRPALNDDGPCITEAFSYRYEFAHYPDLTDTESEAITTSASESD